MPITATPDRSSLADAGSGASRPAPVVAHHRSHLGWRRAAIVGAVGLTGSLAVLFSVSVGANAAAADPCVTPVACASTTSPTTQPPPSNPPPSAAGPASTPPPSSSQPQPKTQDRAAPAGEQNSSDAELLQLVNADRAQQGLPALSRRADLDAVARPHSADMAAAHTLSHNDSYFTPASHDRLNALVLGENVAENSTSVANANARLMASPHHRANILDPRFTAVGISVFLDNSGTYWITEDFLQARPVTSPASRTANVHIASVNSSRPIAAGVAQPGQADGGTVGVTTVAQLVATTTSPDVAETVLRAPVRRAGRFAAHHSASPAAMTLSGLAVLALAALAVGARGFLPGVVPAPTTA